MSKRIQPCVEALEAKVALSTATAHLGSVAVEKPHAVHVEALSKPVTITGTYAIRGSSNNPIVEIKASSFTLPKLGTVAIIGTESTSTSTGAVVNTLFLFTGSNFYKMSVSPNLYFSSKGLAGISSSHSYTVLPNGKDGTGTIDFSLQANSAFTMKFIPA